MSFADITATKAAIADWMHRSDLTTAIGDFVSLFEADFNSQMRVRQMEAATTFASTTGFLQHPTGWLGWKQVSGTNGGVKYDMKPVTDEIADLRTAGLGNGTPAQYYKVFSSQTNLYPATNATFITKYYAGVALTTGTNWLLTAYPGAYLYGSLVQAGAFIDDDAKLARYAQMYQAQLEKIKADSRKGSWSGQVLQMAPDIRVV